MLHTSPISDITWAAIESFCEKKLPENATLDYKKEIPNNLEKTIAAMANTLGGIVIIGVEETKENKPVLPLTGVDFQKGYEEKIHNLAFDNITPPVIPEVAVCCNEKGDKVLILVRVPQSPLAPHALNKNTLVYFRTGSVSQPEENMALDKISALLSKREEFAKKKETLIAQSQRRYEYYFERVKNGLMPGSTELISLKDICFLEFSVCPTFPVSSLIDPPEIRLNLEKIQVKDQYGTSGSFPHGNTLNETGHRPIVKDGFILIHRSNDSIIFTELNVNGLFFIKYPLKPIPGADYSIRLSEIICKTHFMLKSAVQFLNFLGYWGSVDLSVSLKGMLGKTFYRDLLGPYSDARFFSPDNDVSFFQTLSAAQLDEGRSRLLTEIIKQFGWSINTEVTVEEIQRCKNKFQITD